MGKDSFYYFRVKKEIQEGVLTTVYLSMPCCGLPVEVLFGEICPNVLGKSCRQPSCTSAIGNSVYVRLNRWAKKGVWKQVFEKLQEPDLEWVMTDSTVIRAHQHAAGQKKTRQGDEAIGKSKGGKTTKVTLV
jgi:hypothetical protein